VASFRPRRRVITGPGALTRSELRIAELAAAGRQNREIAEALVVTLATVEYHLRNAYRKLGIRSRTQLAEVLVAEAPAAATTVTYRHWESRSAAATATAVSVVPGSLSPVAVRRHTTEASGLMVPSRTRRRAAAIVIEEETSA
jgi:DNA-binding CsgD family transcriptional regulator